MAGGWGVELALVQCARGRANRNGENGRVNTGFDK